MKVAKLVAPGRMEVSEEPVPEPGPGELLVRVRSAGICGSDLHYFLEGGLGSSKIPLPVTLGHEPAGVIEDVNGSRVFANGDRIAIDPNRPCGKCECCLKGLRNLCVKGTFMGSTTAPGCLSEFVVIGEDCGVKLTGDISFEEAALLEPFGVGLHAVNLAALRPGSTVAIFGAGAIGLCVLQAAQLAGAALTFIVDKLHYRLEAARRIYQPDYVFIDAEDKDPASEIRDATNGKGVDVAFDAAGMQRTIQSCFRVAMPGGKVVLVGIPTYDYVSYNPHVARIKELTVINTRRSNQTLATSLALLDAKKIRLCEMVTCRYGIEDVQTVFEIASEYKDGIIKGMIEL